MDAKIQLTIVGGFIGLFTAIVSAFITNYINKKVFREELAENDITKKILEDYKLLWEAITQTNHNILQLLSWMNHIITDGRKNSLSDTQILKKINSEYPKRTYEIQSTVMNLNKFYLVMPAKIIDKLQDYEESVVKLCKSQNPEEMQNKPFTSILPYSEELFNLIKENQEKIIKRKIKISDSIGERPLNGYIPKYIKDCYSIKSE